MKLYTVLRQLRGFTYSTRLVDASIPTLPTPKYSVKSLYIHIYVRMQLYALMQLL